MLDHDSGERPAERADFEPARLNGLRRRPLIAIVGWVVVLGGVVALGLTGRTGEAASVSATQAAVPQAGSAIGRSAALNPTASGLSRRFDPAFPSLVVVETGETTSLAVRATRQPSTVAIHGVVLAHEATTVMFVLRALDGYVAKSIEMSVPELLADGRNSRPSWPMDVEFAIPTAMAASAFVVEADLYGPGGARIDLIRLRLAPEM
jgi:hypothetical protein